MKRNHEIRHYTFRAEISDQGNGVLTGIASQVGVIDAYRSVIMPKAFDGCLGDFLKAGHVCFNHDSSKWIGFPTSAKMNGRNLEVSGEFYDDEFSQSVRKKIATRLERNLTTDFSIGFRPDWDTVNYFGNGEQLWQYAAKAGEDVSLIDPSVREFAGYCWSIGRVKDLGEWGPVMAGATPGASATGVRSLNDLRDGSLAGLSLENHLDCALAAVEGAISRFEDYAEKKADDGRAASTTRLAQIEALASSLSGLAARCRADDPKWRKLQMEADAFLSAM